MLEVCAFLTILQSATLEICAPPARICPLIPRAPATADRNTDRDTDSNVDPGSAAADPNTDGNADS